MEILLIIFLVFVVWPLLKFYMALRKAQRQARDAFSQFSGNRNTANDTGHRKAGWSSGRKQRKKVIDSNVGEYVDFEEIPASQNQQSHTKKPNTSYHAEQQVEDAEWEDIK